jgi:hypothetical protein
MTIAELKAIIANWPETNQDGEPTEVWVETGNGLSSLCETLNRLNERKDRNGAIVYDLLLCPSANVWEEK